MPPPPPVARRQPLVVVVMRSPGEVLFRAALGENFVEPDVRRGTTLVWTRGPRSLTLLGARRWLVGRDARTPVIMLRRVDQTRDGRANQRVAWEWLGAPEVLALEAERLRRECDVATRRRDD